MHVTPAGRLVALVSAGVVALLAPQAGQAVATIGGTDFPAALLAALQLLCLAVAAWLLVVVLAALVRVRVPGVPRSVRVLLFATATAVTVTVASGPAQAEGRHDLSGLALPDRPTVERATDRPVRDVAHRVVVRPGDTLWSIAAAQLADTATDADIAAACAAWHRANRSEIGPDPDLIVAGQTFTAPTEESS